MGTGICVAIGGIVLISGAMTGNAPTAENDETTEPNGPGKAPATRHDGVEAPATNGTVIRPMEDPTAASDEDDEPTKNDDPSADEPLAPRKGVRENAPVAPGTETATETPSTETPSSVKAPTTGGTKWSCNASGSVRVCGFANVCSYQMVFGNGYGPDRIPASMMAKNACENMARAKGGSTVCVVSCSPR